MIYHNNSNNWDTLITSQIVFKIELCFYDAVIPLKDADGKANSVGPIQTAPLGAGCSGLHCLLRSICPKLDFLLQHIFTKIIDNATWLFPSAEDYGLYDVS